MRYFCNLLLSVCELDLDGHFIDTLTQASDSRKSFTGAAKPKRVFFCNNE